MAASLTASYQLLKADYPELISRFVGAGATEADLEQFLAALDQKVKSKGTLNEGNFNSVMLSCVEELLTETGAHRNILKALLAGFPEEIDDALQGQLHPGLLPLRNAVLKAVLGTGETGGTGGNSAESGPAGPTISTIADKVERQLTQGSAVIELEADSQLDALTIPGKIIKRITDAGKDLVINIDKITFRLPPRAIQADTNQTMTFSASPLPAEKTPGFRQFLVQQQRLIGPIYEFACSIENSGTQSSATVADFAKPVTVSISYEGVDLSGVSADQLDAFRFNEQTKKWASLKGTLNRTSKTITFSTDSFSKYAIIADTAKVAADGGADSDMAGQGPIEIRLTLDELGASINGIPVTLDAKPYLKPQVSRTMVPLRFLSESLGAKVTWIAESEQVIIEEREGGKGLQDKKDQRGGEVGKTIVLTIDSPRATVDGKEINLDAPAEMQPPGRTFVPLRFVSENLGAEVNYDAQNRTITVKR